MSTFRFYIHTSATFPYPVTPPSKEATQQWSHRPHISRTLNLLPAEEQTAIKRFFHPADASRSLSSFLLKHLAIMHGAGVEFGNSIISQQRDIRNGKPYFADGGVEFNVSHHGEYVVCLGTTVPGVRVGIDVVQIDVEKDRKRMTGNDGFREWVDVFSDVLSKEERDEIVRVSVAQGLKNGLRWFYTVWACKEAYVKMTSDALMAPWMKELEFPGLKMPEPATEGKIWGVPAHTNVKLQGKLVDCVTVELVGLGRDHIVASAIDRVLPLAAFERVEVTPDGLSLQCCTSTTTYSLKNRD